MIFNIKNFKFFIFLSLILYLVIVESQPDPLKYEDDFSVFKEPDFIKDIRIPKQKSYEEAKHEGLVILRDIGIITIHGLLCAIPVVGGFFDATFSHFLGKVIPSNTIERKEFVEKMNEMLVSMTRYTDTSIDNAVKDLTDAEYESIRSSMLNFNYLEKIYENKTKQNLEFSQNDRINLISLFWDMLNVLEKSIEVFSHPSRIHITGSQMIEIYPFLCAAYRDIIIKGKEYGITPELIDGFDGVKTFLKKIEDYTFLVVNRYGLMVSNLIEIHNKKHFRDICKNGKTDVCPKIYNIPDFGILLSTYWFANYNRYNNQVYFLYKEPEGTKYISNNNFTLNKPRGSFFHIDWYYMGRFVEHVTYDYVVPFNGTRQTADFVTGSKGFQYYHNHLYSNRAQFRCGIKIKNQDLKKNIVFRFYYADGLSNNWRFKKDGKVTINNRATINIGPSYLDSANRYYSGDFELTKIEKTNIHDTYMITNKTLNIGARYCFETIPFDIPEDKDEFVVYLETLNDSILDLIFLSLEIFNKD